MKRSLLLIIGLGVLSINMTGCVTLYKAMMDDGMSRINILGPVPVGLQILDDNGSPITIEKRETGRFENRERDENGNRMETILYGYFVHVDKTRDHTLTLRYGSQSAAVSAPKHFQWLWVFLSGAWIPIDIVTGATNEFPDFFATDYITIRNGQGAKYANSAETEMIYAAFQGNLSEVKSCISKGNVDINSIDQNGDTALIVAALDDHMDVVKYLLSLHANVQLKNDDGYTAYNYAVSEKDMDMADMLAGAGSGGR